MFILNEIDKFQYDMISYLKIGNKYEICIVVDQENAIYYYDRAKKIIDFIDNRFVPLQSTYKISEYQFSIEIKYSENRPSISFCKELVILLGKTGADIDIDLL
jgi:hypothetical protein